MAQVERFRFISLDTSLENYTKSQHLTVKLSETFIFYTIAYPVCILEQAFQGCQARAKEEGGAVMLNLAGLKLTVLGGRVGWDSWRRKVYD